MPKSRSIRDLQAQPEDVWRVIANPHHLARWWPDVTRVEAVAEDQFTMVIPTRKGRPMRVDYRLVELEEPHRVAWTQEVIGTPFERVLAEQLTSITIEPLDAGTRIQLEMRQQLRGYARLGGWMLRRANRERLSGALDALAGILD
jgi:uncharacterized protein YndB with AHSA1/START domain